jgi:predicted  nucleic acid-binding Zn-ribbon protein
MKPKKCKNCGEVFDPQRAMQKACSVPCAIELANKAKEKTARAKEARERKVTKEKLDALRTKPQLVKLAQTAFNGFIRARDAGKPCISCGTPLGSEPNTLRCRTLQIGREAPHT